jgi:hypothetical protein
MRELTVVLSKISQITNLKMVEDVSNLALRKCYQCGGETLVLEVKHSEAR